MPGIKVALVLALLLQSSLQQDASSGPKQGKPFFERFRRLEEQVRRFQEVTLNRLQGIAENYNISYNIDAQFQHLTEQFRTLSDTMEASRTSLQGDLGSLKVWMKKLQRKNKKLELKVSTLEQALGDRTKQSFREKKEATAVLSNLTQELSHHRQNIASLVSSNSQLQAELGSVQEAIQGQGARLAGYEERFKHAVQNEVLSPGPLSVAELPNETPQGTNTEGIDTDPKDMPVPRHSASKLLTKHRQRKRLQEKYKHLMPSRAANLRNNHQPDNEAGQQEMQMAAGAQASRHMEKSVPQAEEPIGLQEPGDAQEAGEVQAPGDAQEPEDAQEAGEAPEPGDAQEPGEAEEPAEAHMLEKLQKPFEPQVPAEPQTLRHAEKFLQEPPVPADSITLRTPEKNRPDAPMPAALRATRKPASPAAPEEQAPPPRAPAAICNVDSMLVFPNSSTENFAIFSPGFRVGIHELSICSWVKTGASYLGTILSYATEENDNKLVLHGRNSTNQGTVHFVIGDPAFRELPVVTLLDNRWHHICIIWSSIQGRYWFYVDRRLATTGSRFQKGYELPPDGSLVLGQEQDTVGGGFDSSEAFVGNLAGLAVWDRALSPGEVSGIATGNGQPRGAILTLAKVASVHGSVQKVNCTCLEHCL
ncbi:pentraxin-4 [Ambystoma mexicanum]|uniref:pentraxin-4 n=1 Tax=Ambystoma mexicanum TaxID=8296 RepID=UPI0037E989BC